MLRVFCLTCLFMVVGCNQAFDLDEVDLAPDAMSIDALEAVGLHCELPADINGTCEGVPRQVRCTAASAVSCTLAAPGAIPAMSETVTADATGKVTIDLPISLPVGLTTLTLTCKGGSGTSDASFDLPVRAAQLLAPVTPVSVGQSITVSFSAPDVVQNNVVLPCSMSIGSITNLYATGMASNTFSWNVPGTTLPIQMECRDSMNQPMYACTKQVIVQ